jgi:hypothetical protein
MVGELEVSNRLIVESKNDKFFIQALVNYLNTNCADIKRIDIAENAYLSLDGSDPTKINNGLQKIKDEAQKNPINKIGIVLDMDYKQPLDWLETINKEIANIFPLVQKNKIEKASNFITITTEELPDIQIACHLMNVNGTGELETILKLIKSQSSPYADCLESWRSCVEKSSSKPISQKDFDKLWVNNYIRHDTCTNQEKNHASEYCSVAKFDYVMNNKQHIWDFEHPALDELKEFLKLFR